MSKLKPEWVSRYPHKQKENLLKLATNASDQGSLKTSVDYLLKIDEKNIDSVNTLFSKITYYELSSENKYTEEQIAQFIKQEMKIQFAKQCKTFLQTIPQDQFPDPKEFIPKVLYATIINKINKNPNMFKKFLAQEFANHKLLQLQEAIEDNEFSKLQNMFDGMLMKHEETKDDSPEKVETMGDINSIT